MDTGDLAPCPDDAQLAAFLDHALSKPDHDALERHLHGCEACLAAVGHAAALGDTQHASPPGLVGEARLDEVVGRFTLREVLGVGGMGAVYAAYDPQLQRNVAIKLLHGNALEGETAPARRRLLREAQAMAKVDHPNVIHVYDVGEHDGQIYVAMELADTGTLRAWLAAAPRSTDAILGWFIQAGRGLAAAHAAGLIHRDFKPDNVLLLKGERACVTDFGLVGVERAASIGPGASVARTDAGDGGATTTARTAHGGPAVTARSADEPDDDARAERTDDTRAEADDADARAKADARAEADDADARAERTDATAPAGVTGSHGLTRTGAILGTPLYMAPEQFAGEPVTAASDQFSFCVALYEALFGAHPFGGATLEELAATVTRGVLVAPPRTAGVPAWLRAVLARGLARRPEHRFPSMTALVDELARDRRARRRAQLVAVTGGVGVAALAALSIAVARAPDRAATCTSGGERAARVWSPVRSQQLEVAFRASGRPHAPATLARLAGMVEAWQSGWAGAHRDACEATHVRGEQSEHVLDLRMQCLTDQLDQAAATLDAIAAAGGDGVDRALDAVMAFPGAAACQRPAERATATRGDDPRARAARRQLTEARAAQELGRYASARDAAQAAVSAARTEAASAAGSAAAAGPLLAEALLTLGEAQLELADRQAIDSLREATHLARSQGDVATELAASSGLVSALTRLRGKYEVALEVSELADATAARARPSPELLVRLDNTRGDLDLARGKPDEARQRYERALARAEQDLGADHPDTLASLERLGNALKAQGKFADARARYERVLATRERLEAPDHPDVANALSNLGNVARAEGKLDVAAERYERALAIRIAALGPAHPAVAASYNNLGAFRAALHDLPGARRYFDQAIALYEKIYGADSVELGETQTNLGNALVVLGELEAARAALGRARHLFETKVGPDDPHLGYVISELGVIDEREGKLDDALAKIRAGTQLAIRALGADHPQIADFYERESSVLASQNKLPEAGELARRAMQLYERSYGREHPRVALALASLAGLDARRGDYAAALTSWQQSLAVFEATVSKRHPSLAFALAGIGDALTELGRADEALPFLERALQIRTDAHAPPALVAEVHFYLAAALVRSPATRARGLAQARTALALYEQAGDDDNARELKTWLARHRGPAR